MEESDFSDGSEEEMDGHEETLDPENPDHYFPIMERNFNKTLNDMEQNPEAHQFTVEFTSLFEAFYQAFSKQKDLEEKTMELQKDIDDKNQKLSIAIQITESDKKTIDDLKEDIQHAWKLADAAHSREQLAQEIIDNLRRQVENLNAEIDFRNKMAQEEEGDVKSKDGLERERERLINEVSQINTKLLNALSYQEELERKTSEADLKINEYAAIVEDQLNELNRQKRAKEKLESDLAEVKDKVTQKDTIIEELNMAVELHVKQNQRLDHDVKEAKMATEKIQKELDVVTQKNSRFVNELNNANYEIDKAQKIVQEKLHDNKLQHEEILKLKNDTQKIVKVRDILEKKILMLVGEKDEVIADRATLRHKIVVLEREIDELKKYIDDTKRTIESMVKEKDLILKQVQRQQALYSEAQKLNQIHDQTKKKLELELDTFFLESTKQKKILGQLERERDRLAEEQVELNQNIQDQVEEIRQKKGLIFDLKKTAAEQENLLRQHQNQYELMRSDRNALQKSLQESNAECLELKKKLKLLFHQIEQLKEDIGMKEKLLIKDENIMRKMVKEKDNLKIEVMLGINTIRKLRQEVKELNDEQKRLHKIIIERNRTIRAQEKTIEQLVLERDVIGSQLVRRNDEIALLNDKILILQATLARGETHYNERLGDIRLLKIEIRRLRQEKNIMNKSMSNMTDLKQEIFHLERDLTKSRLKCKALEQEVQNPLNIHRWRKLEGSDPEVLELLQKIQILQKRLLHQGSEAVERERQLKESQKLYMNLRQIVTRQPGTDLQGTLTRTQRILKLKNDKFKCLVSELNMAELKVAEYKSDFQKVTEELAELKKKYLAEKKSNRSLRMAYESSRELNQSRATTSSATAAEVKFTGGGFRMSVQKVK